MKGSRYLALISWFGLIEIAISIFPFWVLLMCITWLFSIDSKFLNWMEILGFLYICGAAIISRVSRKKSERMGLKYYYIIPISARLLSILLNKRIKVPTNSICYMLHVNMRKKRKSIREAFKEMQQDISFLENKDFFTQETILIGNTFTDLGSRQLQLIHASANVEVVSGTLLPFQGVLLTRRMRLKQQYYTFGRKIKTISSPSWKIVAITPFPRKETNR